MLIVYWVSLYSVCFCRPRVLEHLELNNWVELVPNSLYYKIFKLFFNVHALFFSCVVHQIYYCLSIHLD